MAKKAYLKTSVTPETWADNMKLFDKNGRALRRHAQQMLLAAFDMADKSGNFDKCLSLYKRSATLGLDKKVMLGFITSVLNVKAENVGKKNVKFSKASKAKPIITGEVTGWWFDYAPAESDKQAQPRDLRKMVSSFESTIKKQLEVHNFVAGQEPIVDAFIEHLNKFDFDAEKHIAPELKAVA